MMGTEVQVTRLPNCNFCHVNGKTVPAEYDGLTVRGMWANMCALHMKMYGVGTGTGRGQRLVLMEAESGKQAPTA